jgi:hypothetical protein
MNGVRRLATVGLIAIATFGAAATTTSVLAEPSAAASTASDVSVASKGRIRCNPNPAGRRKCVAARKAMIREGYRVSALKYNPPGCTQPGGCTPGYFFDYWY